MWYFPLAPTEGKQLSLDIVLGTTIRAEWKSATTKMWRDAGAHMVRSDSYSISPRDGFHAV